MKRRSKIICMLRMGLCLTMILAMTRLGYSQIDTSFNRKELNYSTYLDLLVNNNLEYSAEKFNSSIADTRIEAARIYKDPSIYFEWVGNKAGSSIDGYAIYSELSQTIEIGQKRKARINLAETESQLIKAMLVDYLRNLIGDGTLDYLDAVKHTYLFDVMQSSYQMMKDLANADSVRFILGSIKEIDATQSKIEAGVLLNNLIQIDADRKNSFLNLSKKTGQFLVDSLFVPTSKFDRIDKEFNISELIVIALNNRADLLAAKKNVDLTQKMLITVKKDRIADIDIMVGANNSYEHQKLLAPVGIELYSGIGIPLKFSNLNKSEIKIAQFQIEQAELLYQQIEINIQNEVVQAFNLFQALTKQIENYDHGLLDQSKEIMDGRVYSYSRGETSLLEVLIAQRTYNDLQIAYYETMYNYHAALIELERAVGIWDIEL